MNIDNEINNDLNNKYINGKIYKIVCNITGKIYVGSTTKTLEIRLSGHKRHYTSYLNEKNNYVTSFEILTNGNYFIELICNAACNSKDELSAIEGEYIRELKCINKNIAGRTDKQYRADNPEKNKKYREDNVEKIKQYYIDNFDKIKEQTKIYKKDNDDKLKQKIKCECGGNHTYANISIHLKSIKHQKYLNI